MVRTIAPLFCVLDAGGDQLETMLSMPRSKCAPHAHLPCVASKQLTGRNARQALHREISFWHHQHYDILVAGNKLRHQREGRRSLHCMSSALIQWMTYSCRRINQPAKVNSAAYMCSVTHRRDRAGEEIDTHAMRSSKVSTRPTYM